MRAHRNPPTHFSNTLSQLYAKYGLSWVALAAKTGVSRSTLIKLRNRKCAPSIEVIEKLCKTLNVTATELLGF